MLKFFNVTTLLCIIVAAYMSFIGYKLYMMVNPLYGIEIKGTIFHGSVPFISIDTAHAVMF